MEQLTAHWPLLLVSLLSLVVLIYAIMSRRQVKNKILHLAGTAMEILGILGIYLGIRFGILNQYLIIPANNSSISDTATVHNPKAFLLGIILAITSLALMILSFVTTRMNRKEVQAKT
jgi:drug/metabolite transporter (DMT)-like permease